MCFLSNHRKASVCLGLTPCGVKCSHFSTNFYQSVIVQNCSMLLLSDCLKLTVKNCSFISSLLLARLMGQYCFARWYLSASSSVTLPAGGPAAAGPGAWTVGRLTLHGGPVPLHPVWATHCFTLSRSQNYIDKLHGSLKQPIHMQITQHANLVLVR